MIFTWKDCQVRESAENQTFSAIQRSTVISTHVFVINCHLLIQ